MTDQAVGWELELPPLINGTNDSPSQAIITWKWCISRSYSSPDDIQNATVEAIRWFKNVEGLEHEFLVVTVQRRGRGTATLRLERRPSRDHVDNITDDFVGNPEVLEQLPAAIHEQLRRDVEQEKKALSRHVVKIPDKKENVQNNDTIVQVRNSDGQLSCCFEKVSLVATYSFETPFPLRDLVFAASEVSQHSDAYLLLLQQCYWFCRTIVGVIVKNYPCAIEEGPVFKASGTYTVKALRFPPLQINQDNSNEVQTISDKFKESIQRHDEEILKKYMDGAGGKAIEKERADKEEQRRKDAEERVRRVCKERDELNEKVKQMEEERERRKQTQAGSFN
ncbi:hypothetical protein NLJ89_g1362 [Agrocybe chaxingu]|uniref:Uncharacterized protein n=1 Tax=Agrocybe chaxingu TaxID=84603 RepID=A0A9W8TFD2_9AGAR|nr:hypothetical protein NLJ89_g1362 [Agrocybe chaxingu]